VGFVTKDEAKAKELVEGHEESQLSIYSNLITIAYHIARNNLVYLRKVFEALF